MSDRYMVPMLSLVYLFYFLMISWLLGKKRVDFMYLWRLSADFKKFWWSFTSLGKPKFEFLSMSLVHFIIRLIAIMSTVWGLYILWSKCSLERWYKNILSLELTVCAVELWVYVCQPKNGDRKINHWKKNRPSNHN